MKTPFNLPKLPPEIDYTVLIKQIGDAHRNLGELNALLKTLPNSNLITAPLLTKEAVLSSKIEGTLATLEDVYRYEAENHNDQNESIAIDTMEIINYRKALHLAVKELKKKPLAENLIKKIHDVLLNSVRGKNKDRGNFRKIQVYIGPPGASIENATYIPPSAEKIIPLISNWEKYINSESEKDVLVQMGIAHYQFEAIHPFLDGNGRIGRLLISLLLFEKQILCKPVLYISQYFEKERKSYYDLLGRITKTGDWSEWLKYFLTAMSEQAIETQSTISRMNRLYNGIRNDLIEMRSPYAIHLLDIIFNTPIISYVSIKNKMKVKSNQTIYNLLERFQTAGILKEISGRERNRMYAFTKLLKILK